METALPSTREQQLRADSALILLFLWLISTMGLWFFAFYSLPSEAPDWIRRAQVACFGSNESGLPGPAGWMLLVLSPLMLLGALCIALGTELRSAIDRLRTNPTTRFAAWLAAALVIVECYWVGSSIYSRLNLPSEDLAAVGAQQLPLGYPRGASPAPNFTLIDQFGAPQSLASLRGMPVLLSFVFAHCQTVCPTLVKTVEAAAGELPKGQVVSLFITLDPWRDTPAALPGLAQKWELPEGSYVLSGTPDEVNAVLDAYGVPRERDLKSGDVVHPALVHVIGPKGDLAYSFNAPPVAWLKEAVSRTLR